MSVANSFFSIYTGFFLTLTAYSISHEFSILNNKINYLTQETNKLNKLYHSHLNKDMNNDDKLLDKYKI